MYLDYREIDDIYSGCLVCRNSAYYQSGLICRHSDNLDNMIDDKGKRIGRVSVWCVCGLWKKDRLLKPGEEKKIIWV